MYKENDNLVEEVGNVQAESGTEDMTLAENMKDDPMSKGVNNMKGKDYPFSLSTVKYKYNETVVL